VLNLGHGVVPETSPDLLRRIVERTHERAGSRPPEAPVSPGSPDG
jgi:hypothetical protein